MATTMDGGKTYDGLSHWWKFRSLECHTGQTNYSVKNGTKPNTRVSKEQTQWNIADKLAIQNNAKSNKILICGIDPDEYNRISTF